jgi:hypothetical protein
MMNGKHKIGTDATVSNDDGIKWLEELLEEPVNVLVDRLVLVEPAVAGLALRMATRTRQTLIAKGIPLPLVAYAEKQVVLSGVVCAQLMRLGHRQLWDEFIQPRDEDEQAKR